MTQGQLDMQNLHLQIEQQTNNTDLSIHPLFTDFPVLFLEAMEQDSSNATSDQTSSEYNNSITKRNARQILSEKQQISPEIHNYEQSEQSHGTPPPSKKRNEMMKDPHFFLHQYIHRYNVLNLHSRLIKMIT